MKVIEKFKSDINDSVVRLIKVPLSKRGEELEKEVQRFAPEVQELARSSIAAELPKQEGIKWSVVLTGLAITLVAATASYLLPEAPFFVQMAIRALIALGLAASLELVTGTFQIEHKIGKTAVKATGAVGVFVLVYYFDPPT